MKKQEFIEKIDEAIGRLAYDDDDDSIRDGGKQNLCSCISVAFFNRDANITRAVKRCENLRQKLAEYFKPEDKPLISVWFTTEDYSDCTGSYKLIMPYTVELAAQRRRQEHRFMVLCLFKEICLTEGYYKDF